jgi:hypothetical protein
MPLRPFVVVRARTREDALGSTCRKHVEIAVERRDAVQIGARDRPRSSARARRAGARSPRRSCRRVEPSIRPRSGGRGKPSSVRSGRQREQLLARPGLARERPRRARSRDRARARSAARPRGRARRCARCDRGCREVARRAPRARPAPARYGRARAAWRTSSGVRLTAWSLGNDPPAPLPFEFRAPARARPTRARGLQRVREQASRSSWGRCRPAPA